MNLGFIYDYYAKHMTPITHEITLFFFLLITCEKLTTYNFKAPLLCFVCKAFQGGEYGVWVVPRKVTLKPHIQ